MRTRLRMTRCQVHTVSLAESNFESLMSSLEGVDSVKTFLVVKVTGSIHPVCS